MKQLLQQRWFLFLVLIVFIALKIPHLYYPFWWDESWPYASGVNQMYIHGPSLMPGAISGEVARGHPLMFHFLAACWMKLFGTSNFVIHAFPLFISVVFLAFIYETGLRLFDKQVAATALILVAFQRIFFMESAFLLLEIMLAFLAFASIYFYTKGKHFLTALSLTLLFYTKESGMVVGLVLGVDAFIQLFNKKETLKERWYRIIWLAVPVLFTAIFFVVQKSVSGWYVLPMYSNLENSWDGFVNKFRVSLDILFIDHHRVYYFLLLGLLSVVVAAKLRKAVYLLLLLPILLLGLFDVNTNSTLAWFFVPACTIAIYYCTFKVISVTSYNGYLQKRLVALSLIAVLAFCIFTAINLFVIVRYLTLALIPALFVSAVLFVSFTNAISKHLFIPLLALVLLVEIYSNLPSVYEKEKYVNPFDGMYVQKQMVVYLEQHHLYDKTIASHSFLSRTHLEDKLSGFAGTRDTFKNVNWNYDWGPDIILVNNIEPDKDYEAVKADTLFKRIYRVQKGTMWGEIYARKQTVDIK